MVLDISKYENKKLTWQEIEEAFPNCFVALDDYCETGQQTTAVIRYACTTQKEMTDELEKWAARGILLYRTYTTESMEFNGLWQA